MNKRRKNRKHSVHQTEYQRERKRITSFIRRAEKRGYIIPEGLLPRIPKTITSASVRRLKKITPDLIYNKSQYAGEASYGEIVSGVRGRDLERSLAAKRAAHTRKLKETEKEILSQDFYTRVILSNWVAQVKTSNKNIERILLSWLRENIQEYGQKRTAKMLEEGAKAGVTVTFEVLYNEAYTMIYIRDMMSYMPLKTVGFDGENLSPQEFNAILTEKLELYENWDT